MIPLHDENPVSRPPIVTWMIIVACIGAYFLWQPTPLGDDTVEDVVFYVENAAIPCELVEQRPLDLVEVDATFRLGHLEACGVDDGRSAPAVPGKNVWLSALVSMFLHGSLFHIGGNLLFLHVFGNNVEDRMGSLGFALFYLAGGAVGTAAHVALNADSTVPVVGASGAIAAVMGTYLVLYPHARVRTLIFMLVILFVELRAGILLLAWFVLQFFTDPNEGVAWGAHVGGFLFGVLVGLALRAGSRSQPTYAYRYH
ncbi:MAG TPA: rhomboid family intramembrane serine protease [Acidimicrobiales bacterium]